MVLTPVGSVRVSMSALLRIREGDRYVLFHTPYTPGSYGPPGGVFKFHASAEAVLDRFSFREQRRDSPAGITRRDLRGFLPARSLAPFLRWFNGGSDRESAAECLRRELTEELAEVGHPDLGAEVGTMAFRPVRTVVERPERVPGRDYRQLRLFEVYEPTPTDEAAMRLCLRLLELARAEDERHVILASSQDIIDGRYRELFVGPQSALLFGTRRYRQDIPPMQHT
ncbi:hypothetical protein ACSDR0_33960 [Streptosporangium sp. G11]